MSNEFAPEKKFKLLAGPTTITMIAEELENENFVTEPESGFDHKRRDYAVKNASIRIKQTPINNLLIEISFAKPVIHAMSLSVMFLYELTNPETGSTVPPGRIIPFTLEQGMTELTIDMQDEEPSETLCSIIALDAMPSYDLKLSFSCFQQNELHT